MERFRYPQFCPVARAAEVVGQRWMPLVLRELVLGPQRFSDLRRRLSQVSPSVLADRLALLEELGLTARRDLPPPAGATVYELTERGRAAEPLLIALARFGTLLLGPPRPEDHFEPDWVRVAALAFARTGPTPARRFELEAVQGETRATLRVAGGASGTALIDDGAAVDVSVSAAPFVLLGLLSGTLDADALLRDGAITASGDTAALRVLPQLFTLASPTPGSEPASPAPEPKQEGERT